MAFRVFLSHSLDPGEQTLAWRLQTLATAHGIEMYVPQRGGFVFPPRMRAVSDPVQNAIDRSDCVLAIITSQADSSVQSELRHALAKKKLVIPIVRSDLATPALRAQFPHIFTFSPWENPGKVEGEVVNFLKTQKLSKENRQAIGALVAVGVGLLLLFSLAEK
jgi:nucleoside 2-deoxyribosyltransferase